MLEDKVTHKISELQQKNQFRPIEKFDYFSNDKFAEIIG